MRKLLAPQVVAQERLRYGGDELMPDEQEERRDVLENEKRLREANKDGARHATYLDMAQASANDPNQGRFAQSLNRPYVIGTTPYPSPPRFQGGPWGDPDPVPDESPFGVDVTAVEAVGEPHEQNVEPTILGSSAASEAPAAERTPTPIPPRDVVDRVGVRPDGVPLGTVATNQFHQSAVGLLAQAPKGEVPPPKKDDTSPLSPDVANR
jgi:hypothetical protein